MEEGQEVNNAIMESFEHGQGNASFRNLHSLPIESARAWKACSGSEAQKVRVQKIFTGRVSAVDICLTKCGAVICLQGRTGGRPEDAFCSLKTMVPPWELKATLPLPRGHGAGREQEVFSHTPIFSRSQ